MELKLSSGNHTILDSGTVIAYNNASEISFDVKMDDTFGFTVILSFVEAENKLQKLETSVVENIITFTCTNFNNPIGTGLPKAMELATFNDKKVYFNFWVFELGQQSLKQVSYTFYMEK
ncbi:DUF6864 domain-containing function [Butyricicoccus pullicaecorum]|uniref:Uncharacterized protein n=1 Tax=Butyricicoccus pullicaecorum 1.2 TaxID=1203606 RepID=R8W5A6_9FIRM|nr:hypothetical protein [Butyricicoccus pullicaecorum]EOQ38332.1 hypothetical protein HMPREF1526_01362 [Butyricicoccus pullicaecorum 1.2]SKA54202.1 hypothetical protein SAMN02745978_00491 [Butyricicoccus pullicaecorum DSM 23266]